MRATRTKGGRPARLIWWARTHHAGPWLARALAFELAWRAVWSLLLIPAGNMAVNWYVDANLISPEMTNVGILIDFLTVPGVLTLALLAVVATAGTVFELNVLVLVAERIARGAVPGRSRTLCREAFCRLSNLLHPSTLAAIPWFALVVPLLHVGTTATPVPALEPPRYAVDVLRAMPGGDAILAALHLTLLLAGALLMLVPAAMATRRTSFAAAVHLGVTTLLRAPARVKARLIGAYGALAIVGAAWDALPVDALHVQDYNVYLLRYVIHAPLFRLRLGLSVLQWALLAVAVVAFSTVVFRLLPLACTQGWQDDTAARLFDSLNGVARARGARATRTLAMAVARLRHKRVLAAVLVAAMGWCMIQYVQQRPVPHSPVTIGHRGTGTAPENSLRAIADAAIEGADVVEIDVQLTGDDEVVVFHDETTSRLAADGRSLPIAGTSLRRLQSVRLESHGVPYTMPTLRQAIDAAQRVCDDLELLIELKPVGGNADRLAERVVGIVEDMGFVERSLLMSMDARALGRIRELRTGPQWRVGYCVFWALGNLNWPIGVDFVAIEESQCNTLFVEQAREMGVPVYVWTVNSPARAAQYVGLGVSGIISDDVAGTHAAVSQAGR